MKFETVSMAEIAFGKWFRKETGVQLMPADDWKNPRSGVIYEIKDIQYPSSHFTDRIRLNKESMERHGMMGGKVVIVLCFSDGIRMFAPVQTVLASATMDKANTFGDRLTYFVPLSVFSKVEKAQDLI